MTRAYAGTSIVGRLREVNEDAWRALPSGNAFVVVDGCGGRSSGRVAADLTVQCFDDVFSGTQRSVASALDSMEVLARAIVEANARVLSDNVSVVFVAVEE